MDERYIHSLTPIIEVQWKISIYLKSISYNWQKNSDRWIQTEGHGTTIYQLRACMGICLFSLGKWDLHQQFNCLGIQFGNSAVFGDKGIESPFTILTMRWGAALTAPHRHQSPSSAALTAPHRHQSPSSAALTAPHRHQSPSSAALTAPRAP
jgi:hypothetical protein